MKKNLLFGLLFSLAFLQVSAQSIYKVEMDEKIANATLVAEGKVIAQTCFWNPQHTVIFTANTIELTKVFKGSSTAAQIEIVTVGGSIGSKQLEASDLLQLSKDEIGIFFCYPNAIGLKSPATSKILLDVYSGMQGFLSYDLNTKKAAAPFAEYKITEELYPELQRKTGRSFFDLKPSFKIENMGAQNRTFAPTVDSFTPDSASAGALLNPARNLLTISGSGFGAASGTAAILFDDANDGTGGTDFPVLWNNPLVVSWSNTEIKVRVPSRAGTGFFKVRDAGGSIGFSPGQLYISYSILTYSPNSAIVKESNLMNRDGLGGYTISYSIGTGGSGVDFTTSPALPTFQRALTTWKEISGFRVTEGGNTFFQNIADDDNNIIMYDNSNTGTSPLPAGTLAVCYSWNNLCGAGFEAQKTGFEIVVRNSGYSIGSTSFTYGPCPPVTTNANQIDMETVLLHELGHALNLGHINDGTEGFGTGERNPAKLMNFAVSQGVKRVSPDFSAKSGADYAIAPQGNSYGTCIGTPSEMTPLPTITESKDECPFSFPVGITPRNTSVSFDLVHATANRLVDPRFDNIRCDGTGAGQTNNAWYAIKTNSNVSGTLTLSVSGYTTVPGTLTSCTSAYPGVLATGIRMALYQVASCPAPGSFPSPVNCQTFTGNGALSPISVVGNTTYLLYVEGVENTKATFNLALGGFVLPVKLKDFSGKAFADYNLLSWSTEAATDIRTMMLQKSNDGNRFSDVAIYTGAREIEKNEYKDKEPLAKGYYRLAFKNVSGEVEYSNVVLLQREVKNAVTIYPNPVKDVIHVQVNNIDAVLDLKLYNQSGQLVTTVTKKRGTGVVDIQVIGLAKGIYQLVVSGSNSLETHKVIIE